MLLCIYSLDQSRFNAGKVSFWEDAFVFFDMIGLAADFLPVSHYMMMQTNRANVL